MNEEEYEIYKNEAYFQADELLATRGFDKLDEKKEISALEKLLIEIAGEYNSGKLTLGLFSTICSEFEGSENFHNFSQKTKDIVYSGIDLDYYSYIDVNLDEVKKINLHIKESLN